MLITAPDQCEPLEMVLRQVVDIATFKTPQEFARQLRQRGIQVFVLDVGLKRDQVTRVKAPDLKLDLQFMRHGACKPSP
jgi:hypothetical protein